MKYVSIFVFDIFPKNCKFINRRPKLFWILLLRNAHIFDSSFLSSGRVTRDNKNITRLQPLFFDTRWCTNFKIYLFFIFIKQTTKSWQLWKKCFSIADFSYPLKIASPSGNKVFKQFSPLFLERADFVNLQNIYICNFFIASAIKTSQYVSRRDFKFTDQDSWERYLITLNVYTNAVKNR